MSWDIFVQDLPEGIASIRDLPGEFTPRRDLCRREDVIAAVRAVAPTAMFEESRGVIEGPGYSIDLTISRDEILAGFAFHVKGAGGAAAHGIITQILDSLNLRAIDISSPTGLFGQR